MQGDFVAGYRHGLGELRYHEDGGVYQGEWRRGSFHGQGRREFVNGTVYEGGYVMGNMHGQGKLTLPSHDYYLGEFEDNAFNGTGTYVFANGDRYVGTFLRGKYCGRGRFEFAHGGYYDGEYLATKKSTHGQRGKQYLAADGKREGRGVRVWVSGNKYEGEWKQDKMHGFGSFDGAVGGVVQRYEGMFERGHRHGRGVCTYGAGDAEPFVCYLGHRHDGRHKCTYDGEWQFDLPHGEGRYVCGDGRVYTGKWRNGKRHGHGVQVLIPKMHRGNPDKMFMAGVDALYRAERYEGEWVNGLRQGHGFVVYENGNKMEGYFRNGNLHGPVEITWKKSQRVRKALFEFGMRIRWISATEEAVDDHIADLLEGAPSVDEASSDDQDF